MEVALGEDGSVRGAPLRFDDNVDGDDHDNDYDDHDNNMMMMTMIVTLIMTTIIAVIVTILMMSMDLVKYFERAVFQVRLCGGGPMSTGTTSDELDFAAPFGPTATPVRGRK